MAPRRTRGDAGRDQEEAAERLGCHRTKINRIENGRLGISLGELRDLLNFYGVTDGAQVDELVELARRGREPGWVRRASLARPTYTDFIGYEESADYVRSYQSSLIAGLLQTADYARALLEAAPSTLSDEEIDALITARIERQEVLRRENPPRLCVIQQEASLRQLVGGHAVMREQLSHLLETSRQPGIDLQVIPDGAGAHAGLFGSFVMFGFPNPAFSDVVCVEHRTGTLYMETPEETAEYTLIFDSLRSIALSPSQSTDLITEVLHSL
ncbi:XRE family transcriptional regulator [Streptomyces sp. AJS327]|uniref:helix-turn-helix domain-containing protein n=1 Tax=Streptomyces sp. AJS327 TaxID=2545265 RepID=UPI0015DF6BD1|nr:helix-turn-helix transcriptional regulator [Streptomyces sp. AJS327]MBA0053956.1 XRE family transcriptional regulator [Streptomyces sp. AJS327]